MNIKDKILLMRLLKFKNAIFISIFWSISGNTFGQDIDSSVYYYSMGNDAFRAANYQHAEQFYTQSLSIKKHPDTYFNRAMIYKKQSNKLGYCSDLMEASKLGDQAAAIEFWNVCGTIDTIKSGDSKKGNYEVRSVCEIVKYQDYRKYNKDNKLLIHFFIENGDTIYIDGKEIQDNKWEETLKNLIYLLPKRLSYPIEAIPYKTSGKVLLDFVINKQGLIENVHLLKGLPNGISKACVQAINSINNLGFQMFEGKKVKRKITISMIVDFDYHVSLFKEDMTQIQNYDEAVFYKIVQYDLDSLEKATEYVFFKSGKQKAIHHYSNYFMLIKNGKSTVYFENGQIQNELNYFKNDINGNLNTFYENGVKRRMEVYDKGKVVTSVCFDSKGKEEFCDEYEIMPEFPGGDVALFRFIGKEFKVLGPDRIEGTVWVYFRVGVEGTVKNVMISKSLSPEYDNAALIMMSKMPKWKPGYIDGKAVEVQFALPIKCVIK